MEINQVVGLAVTCLIPSPAQSMQPLPQVSLVMLPITLGDGISLASQEMRLRGPER